MAYAVDRPAWKEVVGIVLACAVLLVLLARLDRAAYEREMTQARAAIAAERAKRGPAVQTRSAAPAYQPAPRTESLGDRGPIVVGVGGAWSAGTAATVPEVARTDPPPGAPVGALRRITGPAVATDLPTVSDAAQRTATRTPARTRTRPRASATSAPAAREQDVTPRRPERSSDSLVLLLAGVGVALMATGGVLVGRGR